MHLWECVTLYLQADAEPAMLPCVWMCLSVCLPVCLPACLSVCLPACLPVCLSVCLSVCVRCEFEAGQAPVFHLVEAGAGSWLVGRHQRKVTLKVRGQLWIRCPGITR
jgi:hypothetical protein